eukprot:XP_002260288.1 hypothetical protein, conserved in Plasmodium species [Plasmodium knowlesi strain H]
MKESVKLSLIISDIRANAREVTLQENDPRENFKIKLQALFSNSNNKDNYFNFFSGLYIFYTLYISYYLYINLEENVDFNDEQLLFYYYLKLFMIKINELKVYIHQDDIIYPEILTEIKIHKDFNQAVHEFILSRNPTYEKFCAPTRERKRDSNIHTAKWKFNIWKRIFRRKDVQDCRSVEEYANLLSERANENNSYGDNGNPHDLPPGRNSNQEEGKSRHHLEDKRGDNFYDGSKVDNSVEIIPPKYVDINILSLFYHENYEKSITHANYRDFFMIINGADFLKLLDELTHFLNKLGELFKMNAQRESMNMRNISKFINNYVKKHIAGTMDLFKYELIFKYYGKQEYLLVNGAKIDCMFIPCKRFLNDKIQSYIDLKKENQKNRAEKKHLTNALTNGHVYLNAFNNDFYNYIYQDNYLCDIPVVLYFNPNAAYYELNACYSGSLKFYLENNVNVFVYNYRGYSKSSGYPNLNRNNLDALKIAEYLLSRKVKHLGLHGTSIGGPLCSYVSYHLCNFNKKNNNMEYMDKLCKNEIRIKITCKQINKTIKLMSRRKDKILNILFIPIKYIILLLQFIVLCKLKISNMRIRRKINRSIDNGNGIGKGDCGKDIDGNTRTDRPKISFVCIDKSFYNFEEVAKYMVGEYAYNILQFTSYKLDITKYYLNSDVPKILIYDNNDEIIHYMSSVVTGVSKEISKLYKSGEGKVGVQGGSSMEGIAEGSPSLGESSQILLPLVNGRFDEGAYIPQTKMYSDLYAKKRANPELPLPQKEQLLGGCILSTPNRKPPFVAQLIIDESVDKCWFENKVKNIDIGLFLQSWKVINDCILFLNKSSTTNNSFISIGLETYKSIMSLYNSKENNLEKQTHNAIYCIYNDNMSFMDTFKKINPNYDDFEMAENIGKDSNHVKKPNVCDMLRENEDFKFEMEKLNRILKDLYMSKRKEVEKVHFTYSGFFLKNDYLYNYINTKNKNKEEPAFNIEEVDIINFLNQFSDSLTEISDAINCNLNSCGQLLTELNEVGENEKINFFKSFIFRMKVYGSYPSQCFISSDEEQYCNSIYQLPFILSECCHQEGLDPQGKVRKYSYDLNHTRDDELLFDGEYPNSDSEDIYFMHSDSEKRTNKVKGERSKDTFNFNPSFAADYNYTMLSPYVVIKRSMFLHDLIVCLNWFKRSTAVGSPSVGSLSSTSAGVFYQLDEDTYLVNPTQLLHTLKAKNQKWQNSQKNNTTRLSSGNFLDLFSNDIGVDINNADFSKELEKYVSWMRLNNRMSLCKILLSLKNELRKMKNYTENLIDEYSTINQNTNIHFIIFLIYRILIFKKLLTHTYIIYTFWERLSTSLDVNINDVEEVARDIDLLTLEPISHFDIFYKGAYKVYSPKILGCPLLVNCGHNGTLTKEDLGFFSTCLNFYLKEYA